MTADVLYMPLYSVGEAASLLDLPSSTLRRWLGGYTVAGEQYPPVLRPHSYRGPVTWAEFVEAGLLREYREHLSLQYVRRVIDVLRDTTGEDHPLARRRPYVDTSIHKLVFKVDRPPDVTEPESLFVVEGPHADQLMLGPTVEAFMLKVEFEDDIAVRLRPSGKGSEVVIDPEVAFGIPTVQGVRTEVLAEARDAGEPLAAIARAWDLDVPLVRQALRWEDRRAKAA